MGFFPEDQYDYKQDYPQLGTKHLKLLEKRYELDLPIAKRNILKIMDELVDIINRNNEIPEYPCNGNARITVGLSVNYMYETIVSWGEEGTSPPYKSERQKYNTHKAKEKPYKKDPVVETIEDILGAFDESNN